MPNMFEDIIAEEGSADAVLLELDTDASYPRTQMSKGSLRYSLGSPSIRQGAPKSLEGAPRESIRALKRPEISKGLRWATNIASMCTAFFLTGIIFGIAPLKVILIREEQFHEECPDEQVCPVQIDHYNVMFTLAQFFLSFGSLFVGILMDHTNKSILYLGIATVQAVGLVLFAISDSTGANYFVVSYSLLAVGGSMTMLAGFPASFLLPNVQAGLLAAFSCLFDASSIIFAVFEKLNVAFPVLMSRENLFIGYAVLATILYSVLFVCWHKLEKKHWKAVIEAESAASNSEKESNDEEESEGDMHVTYVRRTGIHERSIFQQLKTFEFALIFTFASMHMLRCNFYIGTINEMLFSLGDTTFQYSKMFGFVLPVGVVFVPFIEFTVRYLGVLKTLHLTNLIGILFGVLLLVPSLQFQMVNFFVFTGFRAYLYATMNTFIAVTFGVSTMGRIIGSCFTSAAIVSLLMYPAATYAEPSEPGGDNKFFEVNCIMLALCVFPSGMAIYYSKISSARVLEPASTGEDQSLLTKAVVA